MTAAVPTRGVRHSITTVTQARRYAEAGWSEAWIARQLGVSKQTVARWVRADRHERWQQDSEKWGAIRAARRGSKGLGRGTERPEFKFARLVALKSLNLSAADIAAVMSFDYDDEISARQVEYALEAGRYPSNPPRKAAA